MPLDTSIPLQVQAPQINPLQQMLQVAQYRYMNANSQAQQQQLDANRATSSAYQQATDPTTGQVDNNKLIGILSQDPAAAYNLPQVMKGIQDLKQANQTYQSGAVKLDSDQLDLAKKRIGFLTQRFGAVDPNAPDFNQQIAGGALDFVKNFNGDPAQMMQGLSDLPPASASPQQRAQWQQRHLGMLADAATQLSSITPKPVVQDLGGAYQVNDSNAQTNPGYIGTTMQKTLDPATASTPTPYYDSSSGQSGNIPRSQFAAGGSQPPPLPPTLPQSPNMPTGNGQPAPMPSGPAPGAPRGFMPTGPALGASGVADAAGQRYASLQTAAQQAPQLMKTYDLAGQAVKGAIAQGKGSASIANAGGVAQTILGAFGAKPTGDSVKDYQLATNYLNSAADQAASSLGLSGSDSRLAAAKAGQPDPSNMNLPALQEAIAHAKGLQQAVLDRQQATTNFLAQNGNSTANLNQFEAQWNKSFDPDVSYIRSLGSPAEQQAAMQKLKAQGQLGAWMKNYQAMKSLGAF